MPTQFDRGEAWCGLQGDELAAYRNAFDAAYNEARREAGGDPLDLLNLERFFGGKN